MMDNHLAQCSGQKRKLADDSDDQAALLIGRESKKPRILEKARNASPEQFVRLQRQEIGYTNSIIRLQQTLQALYPGSAETKPVRRTLKGDLSSRDGVRALIELYQHYHPQQFLKFKNGMSLAPTKARESLYVNNSSSSTTPILAHPTMNEISPAARVLTQPRKKFGSLVADREGDTGTAGLRNPNSTCDNTSRSKAAANSGRQRHGSLHLQPDGIAMSIVTSKDLTNNESHGIFDVTWNSPIYFYDRGQLWVRSKDGVGIVLGINAHRRAQIERETDAKINFFREKHLKNSVHEAYRLLEISGDLQQISKARSIIERLLGDGKNSYLERRRLEVAAQAHLLQQQMLVRTSSMKSKLQPLHSDTQIQTLPLTHTKPEILARVQSRYQPHSVVSALAKKAAVRPPAMDSTSKHMPPIIKPSTSFPSPPQKLTRFTLGETDDESSSSSSDNESETSSDDGSSESEDGAQTSQKPSIRPAATATASRNTTSITPTGRLVIEIEDDSDDNSSDDDPIPAISSISRAASILDTIPKTGTMRVSEVSQMLQQQTAKTAKLQHENNILKYALHYKGVTDFQITRMHAQVSEKGSWDAKFAGILGEPRKGNVRDGGPLTLADRKRQLSGNAGSRKAS